MSNIFTRLLLDTDGFNKNLYQAQKNLRGFAATSKGVFGGLTTFTGYAAAFVGISTSIHSAVTANMEFEKSLSSLRSLTGVSVQELNYFRAEAIKMAMDSTQSAVAMVDAYKLIGSQMPELLKNKEALSATARAAVTLAEAAEIDVPTAAKALTGSLNQMGESSSRASEYINILAAASQQGSADIPYLNKAIENSGGTASSVGVKFNELVAAIEAIAPRITDASSAGTNLRNIFLTLEASTDNNLKPSVVGLSAAIDNLYKKNLNATELTKMFGKESVTAAIALLQEKDAFDQLVTAITGTNTAREQAKINTDNLAGSIIKLENAWTALANSVSSTNVILKAPIDTLTTLINKANQALFMSKNESKQYALDKKYGGSAEAVLNNSNEVISQNVEQFGKTRTKAIENEMAALGRMYPEALRYEQRLKELEAAKEVYSKGWTQERKKALNIANKNFDIAERQKYIYDYVLSNLKSQLQAEKDLIKAKENAEKAAKEKAAAEEAERLAKEKASRPEGSIADIEYQISQKRKEISVAISNKDRIELNRELDELVKKKRYMELEVKYANTSLIDTRQAGDMAELSSTFRKMSQLPKDFNNIKIPKVAENIKSNQDYADSFMQISQAISMMSGAYQDNASSVAQWAFSMIGNVSQMISQLQSLAMAQGVASAFKLPPPASFIAAATVISTVAGIFASIPKFANGGIIGGSSFYGDKLLARVNSGEMILNQNQQKSLYQMTLEGSNTNTASFKVRGSDIYISLKNYLKQTGKKL